MGIVLNLSVVEWRKRWMSQWMGGHGIAHTSIKAVYKHARTGQVRIYSVEKGWPLDGEMIAINGQVARLIRGAGRFGRLHFVV